LRCGVEGVSEKISWIERKTNEEVLWTVKENVHSRTRYNKALENDLRRAPRRPEELHNIITVGTIEGEKTAGCPRNSYAGRIKSEKPLKKLKRKGEQSIRIGIIDQRTG